MNLLKKKTAILICIFILGAVLRIGFFQLNEYNIDASRGDEPWSKINIAIQWVYSNASIPGVNFGPLHTYLIATLYLFNKEHVVISARLVSLVLGILFIFVYFSLLKESFDIDAALFGTFLVAIYPLYICLSSVSLATVPACFLLFSSLYFLYRFMHYQKMSYLILSAVCLNLSCMLRYECWIFVFLFNLILLFRYKFSRSTCIFLILSCIFPIIWLIVNYRCGGSALGFLEASSRQTQIEMRAMEGGEINILKRSFGFLLTMSRGLSIFLSIFCGLGLIATLIKKDKNTKIPVFLFLSTLAIFTFRSIQGSFLYTLYKYSLVLGLLFIPFGGLCFLYVLRTKFFNKTIKTILIGVLLGLLIFSSVSTVSFLYKENRLAEATIDMIPWIKTNIKENDKVLLEPGIYHPFIILNSHLQPNQVVGVPGYVSFSLLENKKNINGSMLVSDYMVICKEDGEFRYIMPELNREPGAEVTYENEAWVVYRLSGKD